jgi:hypothetical protein
VLRFGKYLAGAVLLVALALVGSAGTASAAAVDPVSGGGNPSCAGGLKIEPVTTGQYGPVRITVTGSSFSFSTNGDLVNSVIVKGGSGYNLYSYPAPGVTADSGLTAPVNAKTGQPYGLSHLCFFTTKKGEEPK